MRRTIVIGALTGLALVAGAPAALAAPELTARSCEADGGTFSRDRGVKTCVIVSDPVETPDGPYTQQSVRPGFGSYLYTGIVQPTRIVTTTTTTSQKGNGEVTRSSVETVTAGEERYCLVQEFQWPNSWSAPREVDLFECESRGLFD